MLPLYARITAVEVVKPFIPLKDPDFFSQVRVDPEAGTVVWPNGVDLDPDVLYHQAHRKAGTR